MGRATIGERAIDGFANRIRSRSAVLAEGFQYWRAFIWRSREASGVIRDGESPFGEKRGLFGEIHPTRNHVGRDGGRTVNIVGDNCR